MPCERVPGEPKAEHDSVAIRVGHQRSFSDEPEEHEQHRDDPKPNDDLVLLPSLQFEVMVNRRHPKHPSARQLERRYLDHDGKRFDDEHPTHDGEHDLLADDGGDRSERGAERQRADVPHEHLRRIGIKPEKAKHAPATVPQKTESSPAPAISGNCRYPAKFTFPLAYAENPEGGPTITVDLIARPSKPSVRLTALIVPTITK